MDNQRLKTRILSVWVYACAMLIMMGAIASSYAQDTTLSQPQVTEVAIQPKTPQDTLSGQSKKLDEVVVTAMGITRSKRSLGYATQEIKADEMNHASNPNIVSALQGKVAGVQVTPSSGMPGASSLFTIRGSRFFADNNQPLYVVDGLPIASSPDITATGFGVTGADYSSRSIDINPMDIESINILKGPAAAALYGMRASNGAVIITTKSGKQAKGKPVVTFSTNATADQISRLPQLQSTYAHGSGGVYTHFGSGSWGPKIDNLDKETGVWYTNNTTNPIEFGGVALNPGEGLMYGGANYGKPGTIWVPQAQQWMPVGRYNNPKEFFKTGLTWNTNINVSQAIEQGNYSFSAGNTTQNGIVPNTGMQRYTFNGQGEFNLNKYWKVGFSGNVSSVDINKMPSGNDSYLFTAYSAPPDYNLKGIPYNLPGNPYVQTSYRGGPPGNNPYWAMQQNKYNELTRRFFGNAFIDVTPVKWLNLRYRFGGDFYTTRNSEVQQAGNYGFGADALSSYDPENIAGATIKGGRMYINNLSFRNFNSLFLATAHGDIGSSWNYEVILGNEVNDDRTTQDETTGLTFIVPGYNNMQNMVKVTGTNTNGLGTGYRRTTIGTFANVSFSYLNMLYLNATGRWDIVSSMPTNNRNYFYPSVSASWIFTELEPLNSIRNVLNFGKIRASYAQVGQAASQYYNPYYEIVSPGSGFINGITYPLGGVTGYQPSLYYYNPNLKPQNTVSYEVGADLQFFKNILGISYTFSYQDTRRQIFAVPISSATGYQFQYTNAGRMSGTSHEITIDVHPVAIKNFSWDFQFNFSKIVNKVISLAPGVESITLTGFEDPQTRAYAGFAYPVIYGTAYARNDKGQIIIDDDPNSDSYGIPLAGGVSVLGQVTPDFNLGFVNSFNIYGVIITAVFDWKQGGYIFSGENRLLNFYGVSKNTENRDNYSITNSGVGSSSVTANQDGTYSGGNQVTITRRASDGYSLQAYYNYLSNISEAGIYKNSFVKLRELSVTYPFPAKILKKMKLKGLALTANVRNILIWSSLPNFDPEASQGNGNGQGGFSYFSLPQTMSFGGGVTITF